jgi:hypothetical protein
MSMETIIEGGYLTLWGIALLLCWTATLRLANCAHVALAKRGYLQRPRHEMPPVAGWSDIGFTLVALASGNATLIAFAGTAARALHLPQWLWPTGLLPWMQLLRIVLALAVLLFFLTRIAERPRYKLAWCACWCVFSLGVVSLA